MFYCGPSSSDIARSMRSRDPESGPSSSDIARSMRSRDPGSGPSSSDIARSMRSRDYGILNCVTCLIILGTVSLGGGIAFFLTNGVYVSYLLSVKNF